MVARHYTEASLIEKSAAFWAQAGRQSLERSALAEGITQFNRALEQLDTLAATPARRAERIELQVAVIGPLLWVKGHSSPEAKAATERARVLIEEAEALGEPPENPLLLDTVLYGAWAANAAAIDGDALLSHAAQFLALA